MEIAFLNLSHYIKHFHELKIREFPYYFEKNGISLATELMLFKNRQQNYRFSIFHWGLQDI